MGLFDEYINGLEGRDNIDPLTLVSELHDVHKKELTSELSTREAKINQLNQTIQQEQAERAKIAAELERQKAMNFDLALELPGGLANKAQDATPDPGRTTINDLFAK